MFYYIKQKNILFLLTLLLVIILALGGCRRPPKEANTEDLAVDDGSPTDLDKQAGFMAPLTGEFIEEEALTQRRPLMVVIDNDPTFGEQSGLDKASWVYEIAAEGGITRFLAVFQHQDAPILGPVRSARDYFLDRCLEYDAAISHIGYSPQAKKEIPQLGIISLNEFTLPKLYWRTKDKKMPHNLYTDTQGLFAELKDRGLDKFTPQWEINFLEEEMELPGTAVSRIRIHYPLGVVEYRYQATDEAFARYFRGQAHKDAETGDQIKIKNIVIQRVKQPRVLDSEGRLAFNMVGTGKAKIFRLGKETDAQWKKDSRDSWTRFYGPDENLISFVRGNTWVQVVAEGTRVEIE